MKLKLQDGNELEVNFWDFALKAWWGSFLIGLMVYFGILFIAFMVGYISI